MDPTFLEVVEKHYRERQDHFVDNNFTTYVEYCINNHLHLKEIAVRAFYLLPPIELYNTVYNLFVLGIEPVVYDELERCRYLLTPFLDSNPSDEQVSEAFERLLDTETAEILLFYYPNVVLSKKAVDNAISRKIDCMVKKIIVLSADSLIYRDISDDIVVWFVLTTRDRLKEIEFQLTPSLQQAIVNGGDLDLVVSLVKEFL